MIQSGGVKDPTPPAQDEAFENSSLSEILPQFRPYLFEDFLHGYTVQFKNGVEIVHIVTNKTQNPPNQKMIIIAPLIREINSVTYQVIVHDDVPEKERIVNKNIMLDHSRNKIQEIGVLLKPFKDNWIILPSDQNPNDLKP